MPTQQAIARRHKRCGALPKAAAVLVALAIKPVAPAWAQTELQWWHAIAGGNNNVIAALAAEFNAAQKDYKVVPVYKGTYAQTMNAGLAAFRDGNAPHILQVFEVGTATMMAAKGAVKPVHQLMRDAGEPFDPKAYLPAVASHYSTATGEMLSFPFNLSTMVTWINRDALRKAGLNPSQSPRTWPELFAMAKRLRSAGFGTCGFSTTWSVWAHLEQFSAWHNLPFATKANGLEGPDAELVFNGPLQARHLQTLAGLQKDKTFDYSGRGYGGETRFTSGECPLLLNSSGFYGNVKANARFDWASAPMPYYPDVPGAPQNSIIGGASLWAMGGKTPDEYKGVARFFTFLSGTDRQARLHQESGYLPITRAAYEKTKASGFYKQNPSFEVALLALTNKEPTENSRGLRLGSMVQMREVVAEEIEAALAGEKSAKEALDSAVQRGNQILREFERQAAQER